MVWTAELSAAVCFVIHSLAVLLHCTHWKVDLAAAVYHNHACVRIALAPVCCSCVAILPCIHLQLLNWLSLVGTSKHGAHVAGQITFQVCFQAPFLIPIFGLAEQNTYHCLPLTGPLFLDMHLESKCGTTSVSFLLAQTFSKDVGRAALFIKNGAFMAGSSGSSASKGPTPEEQVFVELEQLSARLAAMGITELPGVMVEELLSMPAVASLTLLRSTHAPHVRQPVAWLRWKMREFHTKQAAVEMAATDAAAEPTSPHRHSPAQLTQSMSTVFPGQALATWESAADVEEPSQHSPKRRLHDGNEPHLHVPQQPAQVKQHCPGCGECGQPPSVAYATTHGPVECIWGRHGCGASWTCTTVPRGFPGSGLLTMWLKGESRDQQAAGAAETGPSRGCQHRLPLCMRCGCPWESGPHVATGDPAKYLTFMRCNTCCFQYMGPMIVEGDWLHYSVAGSPVNMRPVGSP